MRSLPDPVTLPCSADIVMCALNPAQCTGTKAHIVPRPVNFCGGQFFGGISIGQAAEGDIAQQAIGIVMIGRQYRQCGSHGLFADDVKLVGVNGEPLGVAGVCLYIFYKR